MHAAFEVSRGILHRITGISALGQACRFSFRFATSDLPGHIGHLSLGQGIQGWLCGTLPGVPGKFLACDFGVLVLSIVVKMKIAN